MERYIVKVDPRPTERIYIQFPDSLEKKEYLIQDDTTIELNEEPKEITIRRVSSWHRKFTKWRCRYVTVTSLDSKKELYFPVFRVIYSAGRTIKEYSAKLPCNDSSEKRTESLLNNLKFLEKIGKRGKEEIGVHGKVKTDVTGEACEKSSTSKPLILSFLLGIFGIFPEQLHIDQKQGLPVYVKGANYFELPRNLWFQTHKIVTLIYHAVKTRAQRIFRRLLNFGRKWEKIDDIKNVFWFPSKKAEYISQHWNEDAFFGSLFLNGCNPVMIKRYTEDQQKIPMETLAKVYSDIKENIQNGSIYVVDYELLDGLDGTVNTFLAAPIVLLQQTQEDLMPIAIQILRATGRYNLPINITARNTLTNEGGFFDKHTSFGKDEHLKVLSKANQEITYKSLCLPDNVKHRGIENLKNFHYRDDGMAIWDAIYDFVREIVNGCYENDEEVFDDRELQDMVLYLFNYGCSDCPSSLKTREDAIKYITMIMFTCSAQHAAVNIGQYDIYAWMPNGPTQMRKPAPMDKEVTEKYIMDTLPDIGTTLEAMRVAQFLSHVSDDFVPLGQYPEEVANEKHMIEPIRKFKSKLKEIGENIKSRSASQAFPYEYLHPAGMENSITI